MPFAPLNWKPHGSAISDSTAVSCQCPYSTKSGVHVCIILLAYFMSSYATVIHPLTREQKTLQLTIYRVKRLSLFLFFNLLPHLLPHISVACQVAVPNPA